MYVPQAGIIEEMLEDTFESMEDDEMEEAAEAEVDKILFEITAGKDSLSGNETAWWGLMVKKCNVVHADPWWFVPY